MTAPPAAGGARLARLNRWRQELGDRVPPMLRHDLEKRSCARAIDFLEGRDAAARPRG